jgi:hypothetical protein
MNITRIRKGLYEVTGDGIAREIEADSKLDALESYFRERISEQTNRAAEIDMENREQLKRLLKSLSPAHICNGRTRIEVSHAGRDFFREVLRECGWNCAATGVYVSPKDGWHYWSEEAMEYNLEPRTNGPEIGGTPEEDRE